ncbi:hypothetical protein V8E36_001652 [Tilletia maclaganii]
MTAQQRPDADARWFFSGGKGRDWVSFDDEDDARLKRKFEQLGGPAGWHKLNEERKRAIEEAKERRKREQDGGDDGDADGAGTPALRAPPSGLDKLLAMLPSGSDDKADEEKKDDPAAQLAQQSGEKIITKGEKIIVHRIADPDDVAQVQADPDQARSDPVVPVLEDALFSVDVEKMELYPAFWKGTLLRVVRSTWFYSSGTDGSYAPIAWNEGLSQDLEKAYEDVRPWERFSDNDKGADQEDDDDEDEELFRPLPSMKNDGKVKFVGPDTARVFTKDLKGRLLSLTGGALVVRGWNKAHQLAEEKGNDDFWSRFPFPWQDDDSSDDEEDGKNAKEKRQERGQTFSARRLGRREGAAKGSSRNEQDRRGEAQPDSKPDSESNAGWARLVPSTETLLRPHYAFLRLMGWSGDDAREEAIRREKDKTTRSAVWGHDSDTDSDSDESDEEGDGVDEQDEEEEDRSQEPPELILALHGIGQALTDSFDAVDFTYDIEHLRTLCVKLSRENKHLKRMGKGKGFQFIPVCWRTGLSFDQHNVEGNDNFYSLNQINAGAAIPFVRNVISKVILDVPYYLSAHKQKMVDAARAELNRVYKLWCLRNPDFEKRGGRVSLIGHSLGSALTTDLLSEQPTNVPPLYTLSEEERKSNKHLLFNTRHAYLCGSPQGFFFYLSSSSQLIARAGTARTQEGVWPEYATRSEPKYGCLAANAVYNIFDETDPVAFSLSATVDATCSALLRPVELSKKWPEVQAQLQGPQLSISKILQLPSMKEGNKLRLVAASAQELQATYQAATEREEDEDVGDTVQHKLAKETLTETLLTNEELNEEDAEKRRARQRKATVDIASKKPHINRKATGKGKGEERFDLAKLERGQARLNALNPHGRVDYVIPSDGLSEYLEMIGAHMSYWTSDAFAIFILSQTFSRFEPKPAQEEDSYASGSGLTRGQIRRRLTRNASQQRAPGP